MITTQETPRTYEEAVRTLARWHGTRRLGDLRIFAFEDPDGKTVRLVEVSQAFAATEEARPVVLGRSSYLPFRSAVVLLTPLEWEQLVDGALPLPEGWSRNWRQVWPEG